MINKIKINQYRKLKNLQLTFSKKVNAISGTNGMQNIIITYIWKFYAST